MCRDKFVLGLQDGTMKAELLKSTSDGVAEAEAPESAQKANKLITDATKGIEDK